LQNYNQKLENINIIYLIQCIHNHCGRLRHVWKS